MPKEILQVNGPVPVRNIPGATMPDGFCKLMEGARIDEVNKKFILQYHCWPTEEQARHNFHPDPASIMTVELDATAILAQAKTELLKKPEMKSAKKLADPAPQA